MRLEDLVPPLELCKQIPAGEFEDSAFIWHWEDNRKPQSEYWQFVLFRPARDTDLDAIKDRVRPAPTLAEIMEALARLELRPSMDWLDIVNEGIFGRVCTKLGAVAFRGSIAAAALRLYLEVRHD